MPSAGYRRGTPLAVNRWHGSPVGLSSASWVLDRAAPFARRYRRFCSAAIVLRPASSLARASAYARASISVRRSPGDPLDLPRINFAVRRRKEPEGRRHYADDRPGEAPVLVLASKRGTRRAAARTGRTEEGGKAGGEANRSAAFRGFLNRAPSSAPVLSRDCMQIPRGNVLARTADGQEESRACRRSEEESQEGSPQSDPPCPPSPRADHSQVRKFGSAPVYLAVCLARAIATGKSATFANAVRLTIRFIGALVIQPSSGYAIGTASWKPTRFLVSPTLPSR